MSIAFVTALLIAAQATSGNYALAMLHPAVGGTAAYRIAGTSTATSAIPVPPPPIPQKVGAALGRVEELGPEITAQAAAVIDAASGVVLFGKRPYAVRPLASITKLVSALTVVRQRPQWDALVRVESGDVPADPVERHTVFAPGDRVTVGDLLTAALVRSDNVAVRALARSIAQEQHSDMFLAEMQSTVRALGLPSLRVADPAGLSPENRGTAVDAARLLRAAIREEEIAERLQMPRATITVQREKKKTPGVFSATVRIPIQSTNVLLRDGVSHAFDVRGGKTGYLDESGYNLALAVARDGREVIVVVFGSAGNEERFRDARVLADWTFKNFVWDSSR